MNRIEQMVVFMCPGCNKQLQNPATNAGLACRCTYCSTRMTIPAPPGPLVVRPVVSPVQQISPPVTPPPIPREEATVPINVTLPKSLGGIATNVSQETADNVVKVAAGGALVALGVAVAAYFGVRMPSA